MTGALASADRFTCGLACAALRSQLAAVLLLDVTSEDLSRTTAMTRALLAATHGSVRQVALGSEDSDQLLLGGYFPAPESEGPPLAWRPGLLCASTQSAGATLLVIPDLERLSLSTTRSLAMSIGATVVDLGHQGNRACIQPRIFWLAASSSAGTRHVPALLLDRFALRLSAPRSQKIDAVETLLSRLASEHDSSARAPLLPPAWVEELRRAQECWPAFTVEAAQAVVAYRLTTTRELALARLAHSLARLESVNEVRPSHVNAAARLVGFRGPAASANAEPFSLSADEATNSEPRVNEPRTEADDAAQPGKLSTPFTGAAGSSETITPIHSGELAAFPHAELPAAGDPYPEDTLPSEREAAPLLLPSQRAARERRARGVILGAEPARDLRDLALVDTFLQAAKFRALRQDAPISSLRVTAGDLRSYRRAPAPDPLLVLLLDHTALRNCHWLEALLPYFKWAYVERASVCLIQVGAASAPHPLRASRRLFNSVMVPALADALEDPPGRATPLAHGLDLAHRTLQHALHHGRQSSQRALFVLLSDGRGNVPLAASHSGEIMGPVGREGVSDALQAAARLRAVMRGDIACLNPQPSAYADLPLALARALGVEPCDIPLSATREVEG